VPDGGDVYVLEGVLHEWDDVHSAAILSNCRRVMPDHGRLLLVETVRPARAAANGAAACTERQMPVVPGGRGRTVAEFRALLAVARFRLTRIIPTSAAVCLLEAVPI
jgi:SAM-dependent methyltransferase